MRYDGHPLAPHHPHSLMHASHRPAPPSARPPSVMPRPDLPWLDNRFPYVAVGNHNQELDYQDDAGFLQPLITVVHSGFNRENVTDDLALMFFKEDLVDKNGLSGIVSLPEEGFEVIDGLQTVTFGWGLVQEGEFSPSPQLYGVETTTYTIDACGNQSLYEEGSLLPGMYCAGGDMQFNQTGVDACNGDSGGPNIHFDASNDEESPLQVGIVSWGVGCGREGYPGVYVELSKYIGWIAGEMEYVEELKPSLPCFTSTEGAHTGETGAVSEVDGEVSAAPGPGSEVKPTWDTFRQNSAAQSRPHVMYIADTCTSDAADE